MTDRAGDISLAPERLGRSFEAPDAALIRVSPLVRRITAPNSGPMTFKGTNTYVVGRGDVIVIDPGPDCPLHADLLLRALATERIVQILVTHTHRDHCGGVAHLKRLTGATVLGCAPFRPARTPHRFEEAAVALSNDVHFRPDHVVVEGEIVRGDGFTLEAVATPGHTMNHLAYALHDELALFSGDHVMAWSTTVVAPPTGSMSAYMASLAKLRARPETIYWPGHGGPVDDPQRFLRALQHHRRQREIGILSHLAKEAADVTEIVAATYETLDPRLRKAAGSSVLAHLEDLVSRGLVVSVTSDGDLEPYAMRYRRCD